MSETYNRVYFVTGGGTGGHIYPAMAVADALSENAKVYYVGNKRNMELELATQKGYKFLHVGISGMPRKLNPKFFYWGIRLVRAILYSIRYIKKYKPNAVFATGGYVCAPILFCALIFRIPYVLHDCDICPGVVTRFFAPCAKSISLAFDAAKKHIKSKNININGNPIREEFMLVSKHQAKDETTWM